MGLFHPAMPADPLANKISFLLSQTDTKNCLLYGTKRYSHHLLTNFDFLLNKTQFYQKYYYKERLQKYLEEGLASNSPPPKISLSQTMALRCTVPTDI